MGSACFNGAAADQPRRQDWGVDLWYRESRASMGPRLISRGGLGSLRPCRSCKTSFNGAAADQPRRHYVPCKEHPKAGIASMGPRLISRGGFRWFNLPETWYQLASMG